MSDWRRLLMTALMAAWALCFGYSFVAYVDAPYEGAGFPDGLNKVAVFFGWQGVAGMLALAIGGVARAWPRGSGVRRLARAPLFFAALTVLGFAFLAFRAGGF